MMGRPVTRAKWSSVCKAPSSSRTLPRSFSARNSSNRLRQRFAPAQQPLRPEQGQTRLLLRQIQAPDRPAQQTIGQLRHELLGQARMAIAGHHHGALGQVQGVEGVQELLLGGQFLGQEMHVVDEQGVGLAELLAKAGQFAVPHRLHEAIGEVLGRQPEDAFLGLAAAQVTINAFEQVGFADADRAHAARGDWAPGPAPRRCSGPRRGPRGCRGRPRSPRAGASGVAWPCAARSAGRRPGLSRSRTPTDGDPSPSISGEWRPPVPEEEPPSTAGLGRAGTKEPGRPARQSWPGPFRRFLQAKSLKKLRIDDKGRLHRRTHQSAGRFLDVPHECSLQPFLEKAVGNADHQAVLVPGELGLVVKPEQVAWLPNALAQCLCQRSHNLMLNDLQGSSLPAHTPATELARSMVVIKDSAARRDIHQMPGRDVEIRRVEILVSGAGACHS